MDFLFLILHCHPFDTIPFPKQCPGWIDYHVTTNIFSPLLLTSFGPTSFIFVDSFPLPLWETRPSVSKRLFSLLGNLTHSKNQISVSLDAPKLKCPLKVVFCIMFSLKNQAPKIYLTYLWHEICPILLVFYVGECVNICLNVLGQQTMNFF